MCSQKMLGKILKYRISALVWRIVGRSRHFRRQENFMIMYLNKSYLYREETRMMVNTVIAKEAAVIFLSQERGNLEFCG